MAKLRSSAVHRIVQEDDIYLKIFSMYIDRRIFLNPQRHLPGKVSQGFQEIDDIIKKLKGGEI